MTVAEFEHLCDAGHVSANLESLVLEMDDADRRAYQTAQPEQYAQDLRDLARIGFNLRVLELVGA
jgi:hypothetical protein